MENSPIPSEYLLNDPQEINSLKPGYIPKSPRFIDRDTRSDLVDILNGILGVATMLEGTAAFKKLAAQIQALIAIVSESTEGGRS